MALHRVGGIKGSVQGLKQLRRKASWHYLRQRLVQCLGGIGVAQQASGVGIEQAQHALAVERQHAPGHGVQHALGQGRPLVGAGRVGKKTGRHKAGKKPCTQPGAGVPQARKIVALRTVVTVELRLAYSRCGEGLLQKNEDA